ncbi:MAG TPA: XRE family transcriptional regulator [Acidobacteriaceae bacterium]|nr:XRE family transcriptional regulator [Acidobacteriaceae bacterium]
MATNFKEVKKKMTPERRARIDARVKKAIASMALDELREARRLTQAQLAQTMKVDQGSISKIERRTDMYISTLRNFIQAMGGDLRIQAIFADGSVEISQFEEAEIDEEPIGQAEMMGVKSIGATYTAPSKRRVVPER